MNNQYERLLEISDIKEREMLKILDKTNEQHNALLDDDFNRVMEITDLKQVHIDNLSKINAEFNQLIEENADFNFQESSDIYKLYATVHQLEMENKDILTEKLKETKKQINIVAVSKKGFNAYLNQNMQKSFYIDEKN